MLLSLAVAVKCYPLALAPGGGIVNGVGPAWAAKVFPHLFADFQDLPAEQRFAPAACEHDFGCWCGGWFLAFCYVNWRFRRATRAAARKERRWAERQRLVLISWLYWLAVQSVLGAFSFHWGGRDVCADLLRLDNEARARRRYELLRRMGT